jgi:hypothetical protein
VRLRIDAGAYDPTLLLDAVHSRVGSKVTSGPTSPLVMILNVPSELVKDVFEALVASGVQLEDISRENEVEQAE